MALKPKLDTASLGESQKKPHTRNLDPDEGNSNLRIRVQTRDFSLPRALDLHCGQDFKTFLLKLRGPSERKRNGYITAYEGNLVTSS
eukprot:1160107-Pelagomonas_calceolata.AAC.1